MLVLCVIEERARLDAHGFRQLTCSVVVFTSHCWVGALCGSVIAQVTIFGELKEGFLPQMRMFSRRTSASNVSSSFSHFRVGALCGSVIGQIAMFSELKTVNYIPVMEF
jgi:hypothetical protein